MDQPCEVALAARAQLNRETIISLSSFAPENLASRDRWSGRRPVPRHHVHSPHHYAEPGGYYRYSSCFLRRRHQFISRHKRHRVSPAGLSGHAITIRWRSLPRVRRRSVISPQGSSSNGCCHFKNRHGSINVRLSSPKHTPTVSSWLVCSGHTCRCTAESIETYSSKYSRVKHGYDAIFDMFFIFLTLFRRGHHQSIINHQSIIYQSSINDNHRRYFQHVHFVPWNNGCGKKEAHIILIGPWRPSKAAPIWNYLEVQCPCAGGLSAVNAIGTQWRDPINSGLICWRVAV